MNTAHHRSLSKGLTMSKARFELEASDLNSTGRGDEEAAEIAMARLLAGG